MRPLGSPPRAPAARRALPIAAWTAACACADATPTAPQAPRTPAVTAPSAVVPRVRSVAVGSAHTCAVTDAGAVRCWGANHLGQLGDGAQRRLGKPTTVLGIDDATLVRAGVNTTCAVRRGGRVSCWGQSLVEDPRIDRATGFSTTPVEVPTLRGAVDVALSATHACARTELGAILCWGKNEAGQLGDGTTTAQAVPVPVRLPGPAARAIAAERTSCAVLADGSIHCWGATPRWRRPPPQSAPCETSTESFPCARSPAPVDVGRLVADATATPDALCILGRDGRLACVGEQPQRGCRGSACLDDGARLVAEVTAPPFAARSLLAMGVFVDVTGALATWGREGAPACLEAPSCRPRRLPLEEALAGAHVIAPGARHTCAARANDVVCWGANEAGQLGGGDMRARGDAVSVDVLGQPRPGTATETTPGGWTPRQKRPLAGYVLVWGNAELESPSGAPLGRLGLWGDELRFAPLDARYLARVVEDDGTRLTVELQSDARGHCASGVAHPAYSLRARVGVDDLAPVLTAPATLSFDDASSAVLGAGLAVSSDGALPFVTALGVPVEIPASHAAIGLAYGRPGHGLPAVPSVAPLSGTLLPLGVAVRLGGKRVRLGLGERIAAAEPLPDADEGQTLIVDSPCARLRLVTAERHPFGHGVGLGALGTVGRRADPRERWRVRASSVARFESGDPAGRATREHTFFEATPRPGGWCFPLLGSIRVCHDAKDVAHEPAR